MCNASLLHCPCSYPTETNDANNSLSRVPRHIDLDPHTTLCWDVSTYKNVTFDPKPCEKCMPRLVTEKIPHKEKVCNNWKI